MLLIVLIQKISEMQAGKGKTLVTTLPVSLITLTFMPLGILMACTLSHKYPFPGYQICDTALPKIGPLVPPKYVAPKLFRD